MANMANLEGVPPGYEAVSLIEALNGPSSLHPPTLQMPPDGENTIGRRSDTLYMYI